MRSSHAERNPHLVDEHDGENGLIDISGFAAGGEKRERPRQVRKDICLKCVQKRETA